MKKSAWIIIVILFIILVSASLMLWRTSQSPTNMGNTPALDLTNRLSDSDLRVEQNELVVPSTMAEAAEAQPGLQVTPPSGTYKTGDTIEIDILLNTLGQEIDGVDIRYLHYDPKKLKLQDADKKTAGVQIQAGDLMPMTMSNQVDEKTGTITFSQVVSGGTHYVNTAPSRLAHLSFVAREAGTVRLFFDFFAGKTNDANVTASGNDILNRVNEAVFVIE